MQSISSFMSKKYYNPNTDCLTEYDNTIEDWNVIELNKKNVDEFLFLRDYFEAEMQIETATEMQFDDYEMQFENIFKKRLKN